MIYASSAIMLNILTFLLRVYQTQSRLKATEALHSCVKLVPLQKV